MTDATTRELLPDIALEAPDAGASTLHAVRSGHPAVVYFLRSSTCPVCASHVRALVRMQTSGELEDRRLLLVVPGGAREAAHVAARHSLPDATVWASGTGHAEAGLGRFLALQHSGVLVLDGAGAVTYRRTAAIPTQSFDPQALLAHLAPA